MKLAQWFWRRRFLNVINVLSLFRNYLPLEKGGALHLNKLESPLPKDALCYVWLKLAQWFWRRRWKCEKFTDRWTDGQTDRQTTDERWSEKLTELIRIIKCIIHLRKEWSLSTIQWLWRRFLESCQGIFTVAKISPKKKCCPHLKIKWNPLYPRTL